MTTRSHMKVLPARAGSTSHAIPHKARFREEPAPGEVLAIDPKAFFFMFSMGRRDTELLDNGIAVVHIEGPLEHKDSWCWDSYEGIVARVCEAAEDDEVRAVVLKFDSPGGDVDGLNEAVAELVRVKEQAGKPFYAYANELAASAAYALACSCDEIYLPEAAGVGSIGVISCLAEMTKRDKKEGFHFEIVASGERKPDGNPHIEISDGARKRVRKRVDTLAAMFFDLVASSRGLSVEKVESYQADVFYGSEAVKKRLADGVSSWPDFVQLISDSLDGLDNAPAARSRSEKPTDRSMTAAAGKESKAMGLLALRKKKTDALAALKAAKTEAAKKKAGSDFRAACRALADAEAVAEAKKMKKTKYVEETLEEDEESEEDEEDDDDEDDDDEDAEDESEDSDAESEEDDEDAEDEDAEEEAHARPAKSGAFMRKLARITGASTPGAILGKVRGAIESAGKVRKLDREMRAMRVEGMIKEGRRGGKIEKGLVAFCRKMGMRGEEGEQELAAYLDAKAPTVHTQDDAPIVPRDVAAFLGDAAGVVTSEQAQIASRMGMTPEEAARVAGKVQQKLNGAAPKR